MGAQRLQGPRVIHSERKTAALPTCWRQAQRGTRPHAGTCPVPAAHLGAVCQLSRQLIAQLGLLRCGREMEVRKDVDRQHLAAGTRAAADRSASPTWLLPTMHQSALAPTDLHNALPGPSNCTHQHMPFTPLHPPSHRAPTSTLRSRVQGSFSVPASGTTGSAAAPPRCRACAGERRACCASSRLDSAASLR